MITIPRGRQIQKYKPYKHYIHIGRGTAIENFPVTTVVKEILHRGYMKEIREDIIPL